MSSGQDTITSAEMVRNRHLVTIGIITHVGDTATKVRQALKGIGFEKITVFASYRQAIDTFRTRKPRVTLFEAKKKAKDVSPLDFIESTLKTNPDMTMVALSDTPRIDDIFSLIKAGAKGFVLTPFTPASLEESLLRACNGFHLSPMLLNAQDRNGALAVVVLNNLYRVAMLMHNVRKYSSAEYDLERYRAQFIDSVDLARLFFEGPNESALVERIIEECLNRAKAPRTRLGHTRQELDKERTRRRYSSDTDALEA